LPHLLLPARLRMGQRMLRLLGHRIPVKEKGGNGLRWPFPPLVNLRGGYSAEIKERRVYARRSQSGRD
jgi:hypothetical protein